MPGSLRLGFTRQSGRLQTLVIIVQGLLIFRVIGHWFSVRTNLNALFASRRCRAAFASFFIILISRNWISAGLGLGYSP